MLLCLLQEKCTHGVTTMRANLETEPQTPFRGLGWWLHYRARKLTELPVGPLTLSPGLQANPLMLENYPYRLVKKKELPVAFLYHPDI